MSARPLPFLAVPPALALAASFGLPPEGAPGAAGTPRHGRTEPFATAAECAVCHSVAPGANAMRTATGEDVSPHGLWQATMMANSFRDPYFQAQLQKESQRAGEAVQELCLRCHAPMAYHARTLAGDTAPRLADLHDDLLAEDGVSCTLCHQITADGLGEERTFSGRPVLGSERQIFGPFPDPAPGPMRNHVRYTPVHAPHVQRSALCGSCHTLVTEHQGRPFAEQTPYLEWRNSVFSDEDGVRPESRTCQQCHMARTGPTRMARNPMGADFLIPVRPDYSAHAFVGGNAFMLDLLRQHREELGVTAEPEALARMAAATRRQLGEATAELRIEDLRAKDGVLRFGVRVVNLTGHKFPTGYPARRAWLHLRVQRGRRVLFESGAFDREGRLVGVADELRLPHVTRVERPEDVVVYELVAEDPDGEPTTHLTRMVARQKDNRLLPRGWRRDGPHAAETAPVGTGSDLDFVAGSDLVACEIPLPAGQGGIQVVAWLHYQSVPPAWVDGLRAVDAEAAHRFVRMYDGADRTPETVAVTVQRL